MKIRPIIFFKPRFITPAEDELELVFKHAVRTVEKEEPVMQVGRKRLEPYSLSVIESPKNHSHFIKDHNMVVFQIGCSDT